MADSLIENDTPTFDVEAASARIGESLFGSSPEPAEAREEQVAEQPVRNSPPTQPLQAAPSPEPSADLLPPPKSWRQDMHPHWGKMPKEAQQYYVEREKQMLDGMQQYRRIQDVLTPFEPLLSQKGVSVYDWVQGLVNAERMLTQGTPEQRQAAYRKLGEQLGFANQPEQNQTPVDPMVKQLQDKIAMIESGLTAQQQAVYNETKSKIQTEVDVFAADTKAHPYFDEVADDMQVFLRQGLSLQDAYDRAVWANPATRTKEQARALTEHEAKLKENARLSSLPKKKAASVNVRNADSNRTPTEPVGSIEDTIKAQLREIRQRAS